MYNKLFYPIGVILLNEDFRKKITFWITEVEDEKNSY